MPDPFVTFRAARPGEMDRLRILLADADERQRAAAAELIRHLTPISTVIEYLERRPN